MTATLTESMLFRRWPHAPHSLALAIVADAADCFAGMPDVEIADFMAQMSEETAGGTELEENLDYSAARLMQVWPRRFGSMAEALPFAHNPRLLADAVYGGRMGNRPGTDDGFVYRGRGGLQVTGRTNYANVATLCKFPLETEPEFATAPGSFLRVAVAAWKFTGAGGYSVKGDFIGETKAINGGLNGLNIRAAWRKQWRGEFGLS